MFRTSHFVLLALLSLLLGCSSESDDKGYLIYGEVTYQGQPVEQGEIAFLLGEKQMLSASIRDGKYHTERRLNLQSGEYAVKITGTRKSGKKRRQMIYGEMQEVDIDEQYIPASYNESTELKVSVEAAKDNSHDFNL